MSTEKVLKYLNKAEDFLIDASENFTIERYSVCINRSYYTMFTCVQALFIKDNILVKSHKGTLSKFAELYIKTNLIDKKYGTLIGKAFEGRQDADYDLESDYSEEEVKRDRKSVV